MRIYDIHNQHPEWVENPTAYRAEIREAAHAYIWDFFKMGADVRDRVLLRDLNAIAANRSQILTYWDYNGNPETEPTAYKQDRAKRYILEKVFGYVIRYLAYYGYALQYDEVEHFYLAHEDKDLDFISREEWLTTDRAQANEDFAEIAESLHRIERKEAQQTNHINLGNSLAESLYNELSESKTIIDCNKNAFLWYFGDDCHRANTTQPEQIKWNGTKKDFAYLCMLLHYQTKEVWENFEWEKYCTIFANYSGSQWSSEALAADANKMKYGKPLPAKFKITTLVKGLSVLAEQRIQNSNRK